MLQPPSGLTQPCDVWVELCNLICSQRSCGSVRTPIHCSFATAGVISWSSRNTLTCGRSSTNFKLRIASLGSAAAQPVCKHSMLPHGLEGGASVRAAVHRMCCVCVRMCCSTFKPSADGHGVCAWQLVVISSGHLVPHCSRLAAVRATHNCWGVLPTHAARHAIQGSASMQQLLSEANSWARGLLVVSHNRRQGQRWLCGVRLVCPKMLPGHSPCSSSFFNTLAWADSADDVRASCLEAMPSYRATSNSEPMAKCCRHVGERQHVFGSGEVCRQLGDVSTTAESVERVLAFVACGHCFSAALHSHNRFKHTCRRACTSMACVAPCSICVCVGLVDKCSNKLVTRRLHSRITTHLPQACVAHCNGHPQRFRHSTKVDSMCSGTTHQNSGCGR